MAKIAQSFLSGRQARLSEEAQKEASEFRALQMDQYSRELAAKRRQEGKAVRLQGLVSSYIQGDQAASQELLQTPAGRTELAGVREAQTYDRDQALQTIGQWAPAIATLEGGERQQANLWLTSEMEKTGKIGTGVAKSYLQASPEEQNEMINALLGKEAKVPTGDYQVYQKSDDPNDTILVNEASPEDQDLLAKNRHWRKASEAGKETSRAEQIRLLTGQGVPLWIASGIATGRFKVSTDPQSGEHTVQDLGTMNQYKLNSDWNPTSLPGAPPPDVRPTAEEPPNIMDQHSNLNFVQRARDPNAPVIENADGTTSTHKMAAEIDEEGNWYAFPTIIQQPDGSLYEFPDNRVAMDHALTSGENIPFGRDGGAAQEFAAGGYKAGLQQFGEPARDTLADIDIEKATGGTGLFQGWANAISSAIGQDLPYQATAEAEVALKSLNMRTMGLLARAVVPGRESVFVFEQIKENLPEAGSLLRGDEVSRLKLVENRRVLQGRAGEIQYVIDNPEEFKPEVLQKAKQDVVSLQTLVDDYTTLLGSFIPRKDRPALSSFKRK